MKLLLISFIVIISITCHKSTDLYPDCFKGLSSPAYNSNSCVSRSTLGYSNMSTLVLMSKGRSVLIELNDSVLHLQSICTTYNITDYPTDIIVKFYTYSQHPDSTYFNHCTDAFVSRLGQKTTWTAVSGTITAAISKIYRQKCEDYKASIRLDNVKFISGNSDTTISLILKDKTVNSCIP